MQKMVHKNLFHPSMVENGPKVSSKGLSSAIEKSRSSGHLNLSNFSLEAIPMTLLLIPLENSFAKTPDLSCSTLHWWDFPPFTKIILAVNRISSIPDDFCSSFTEINVLDLHQNCLQTIPPSISNLCQLTVLDISHNEITALPRELFKITSLISFNIAHNQVLEIPSHISAWTQLNKLDISHNRIQNLPNEIVDLPRLSDLNLSHNEITSLPADIHRLENLSQFDLNHNHLQFLPNSINQ
eukprot:Sdes_comp23111_c0_seq1m21426